MDLNFDDFNISKGDMDFFNSLSKTEKLWFLYDLLCDQSYGTGSADEDVQYIELDEADVATIDPKNKDSNGFLKNFEDIADQYNKMAEQLDATIDKSLDIHVLMLNNFLVFNSISIGLIQKEVKSMFDDGYILKKYTTTVKSQRIFQHQKFCFVYEILGKIPKYSKN
jgi:hypothetical protein